MNLLKKIVVLTLVIFFSFGGTDKVSFAGDTKQERATLKGISGVLITIRDVKLRAQKFGLHESNLQTDAEIKLRLAGIKVLTETEWFKKKGMPYIDITVHIIDPSNTSCSYLVSVKLIQNVRLERDPSIHSDAVTWIVSNSGVGTKEDVRSAIKDLVDKFINAYLSSNPR